MGAIMLAKKTATQIVAEDAAGGRKMREFMELLAVHAGAEEAGNV